MGIEEIIEEAKAYDMFFNKLLLGYSDKMSDLIKKVLKKHPMNEKRKERFLVTAKRADNARSIIKYFESQFGVDDRSKILDPRGLHDFIYGNSPENLDAISYHIGLQFVQHKESKKGRHFHRKYTNSFDQLHPDWKNTKKRIGKQSTNFNMLTFFTYDKGLMSQEAKPFYEQRKKFQRKNNNGIKNSLGNYQQYFYVINSRHEIRHIINNIIDYRNKTTLFFESQATLFEYTKGYPNWFDSKSNRLFGFERDGKISHKIKDNTIVAECSYLASLIPKKHYNMLSYVLTLNKKDKIVGIMEKIVEHYKK